MKIKREIDKEEESGRYKSYVLIVAFVFSLLVARLYYLQIIREDYYKQKAFKNSFRENVVKSNRGKIYDVNGVLLAKNVSGYKVIYINTPYISKEQKSNLLLMKDKNIDANEKIKSDEKLNRIYSDIIYLSNLTGKSFADILDIIYTTKPIGQDRIVVIDEDIDEKKAFVEVEKIPNDRINIVEYSKRAYPKKELASHIIGYVKPISQKEYENKKEMGYNQDDLIGKKGIESSYDEKLKGSDGYIYVEVNAKGAVIDTLDEKKAIDGDDIYLSIDSVKQEKMTEYMKDSASTFIAVDIKTGKILTFVSSPEIDSNLLGSKINEKMWNKIINDKRTPLLNKGIQGMYPPGSTFKPISGISFLENGISANEEINSTGKFEYGNVVFKDSHWNGHGLTNFSKSIEESVNTYYYELSLRLGIDKILKTSSEFGLGEKTGIDIPGEYSGLLPSPEWKKRKIKRRWVAGDTINMSIGQGYLLVTPLQILMAYQAIANNGMMIQPTLVDKIVSRDGVIKENISKERKLNISKKNLKIVKDALRLPVSGEKGTAYALNLPYVKVSAKTGTAQNPHGENHSWIAGFFPSDKPEIAFVSFVEGGGYGSRAAAKQAKKFIELYYGREEEEKNGEEN